jgi:hypothetical protein
LKAVKVTNEDEVINWEGSERKAQQRSKYSVLRPNTNYVTDTGVVSLMLIPTHDALAGAMRCASRRRTLPSVPSPTLCGARRGSVPQSIYPFLFIIASAGVMSWHSPLPGGARRLMAAKPDWWKVTPKKTSVVEQLTTPSPLVLMTLQGFPFINAESGD